MGLEELAIAIILVNIFVAVWLGMILWMEDNSSPTFLELDRESYRRQHRNCGKFVFVTKNRPVKPSDN